MYRLGLVAVVVLVVVIIVVVVVAVVVDRSCRRISVGISVAAAAVGCLERLVFGEGLKSLVD